MTKLKGLLSRNPGEAMAVVKEPLAEVRARLESLVEQRAIVEAAPRALAEAEASVDDFIALAAGKVPSLAGFFSARPSGYVDAMHTLRHNENVTAIDLLCAVTPNQVKAWITGALPDHYASLPAPMTAEERQAELARLDAEIAEVERQEVELCWSLLDTGIEFEWRPDVRVELVLGLDPDPEQAA
jgi:hypothetical protein